MRKYFYRAPYGASHHEGLFKNKKEVARFIRKIDFRYKRYSTKKLIDLWSIFRT